MLSVIVVNWNGARLTRSCLASIDQHTAGIAYEVIVVDNGSSQDQLQLLRDYCSEYRSRLIELNCNLHFGEANNVGAESARGEFLLLLNNDVTLTSGYFGPLLQTLREEHSAGAVGPKFVYPGGKPQESGGYVRPDGWTIQHGKFGITADALSKRGPHVVDYCSAACLLIRRDVFLNAGGFDPLFDPAYFEDVDLMLRLRCMGLFTYLCTDVTVVHDENTTAKVVWGPDELGSVVAINHRKFMDRWGSYISDRLFHEVEMPIFQAVPWIADPANYNHLATIYIQQKGLVRDSFNWRHAIRLASELPIDHHIIFTADEACSRCRMITLADRINVRLNSFSIKRTSDVRPSQEDTVVALQAGNGDFIEIADGGGPLIGRVKNIVQLMR